MSEKVLENVENYCDLSQKKAANFYVSTFVESFQVKMML